jgi:hypothetical protein
MNPSLHSALLPRLMVDFAFRETGESLRQGKCPSCGKKELYTFRENPWVLRCGRLNKCGVELHIKELYPDLFEKWSERHPRTKESPHAAADAYLRDGRGFNLEKIKGWYTQEQFWDSGKNIGSATVRFHLGKDVYWERLIDEAHRFGDMKARFHGQYGGIWWGVGAGPCACPEPGNHAGGFRATTGGCPYKKSGSLREYSTLSP